MNKFIILFILFISSCFGQYVDRTVELLDAGKGITVVDSVSGKSQFVGFSMASGHRMRVWFSAIKVPNQGSQSSCSDPCSITINRSWGNYYRGCEEVDSGGSSLSPVKLCAIEPVLQFIAPTSVAACPLPVEVVGQDGFYKRCQFTLPSGAPTTSLLLYMRLFNPGYQTIPYDAKISYRLCNNGNTCTAWTAVTNSTITQRDENRFYTLDTAHGLGGFRQTIEVTVPVTDSVVTTNATNEIDFRFNGTDGVTSGYRVLAWNLLNSTTQKTITQIAVSSNVATASATSHGYSSGDDVRIFEAPQIHGMLNGSRHLTGVATNTFTFSPCGSGLGFYMIPSGCSSPDGTYVTPITQASGTMIASYPYMAQQTMYAIKQIIPESSFTYDDPSTWTAGSGNATNGATAFKTATLLTPNNPYFASTNNTSVHCSSCHFDDTSGVSAGADLQMFNYSNPVLFQRSLFHGLTVTQANDIVAYIRGLTPPTASWSRPWNPPFQPCPGVDSQAANLFYAGGGIDCQLTYDNDVQLYLIPGCTMDNTGTCNGGSFTTWAAANEINMRQLPQLIQGWTWNQWLPLVHPADGFPLMNFFSTAFYTDYTTCRTDLAAQTNAAYKATPGGYCNTMYIDYSPGGSSLYNTNAGGLNPFILYPGTNAVGQSISGMEKPSSWTAYRHGLSQFFAVKMLELMTPNYITMLDQQYTDIYGSTSDTPGYFTRGMSFNGGNSRTWFNFAFHITGNTCHTPWMDQTSPCPNNSGPTWNDQTNSNYVTAMVLNGGNRQGFTSGPLDWPYTFAFLSAVNAYRPSTWLFHVPWMVQVQQGWDTSISSGNFNYVPLRHDWFDFNNETKYAWINSTQISTIFVHYANLVLDTLNHDTAAHWLTGLTAAGVATCNAGGATTAWQGNTNSACDGLAMMLPMIDNLTGDTIHTTTDSIAAAAHAIWPAHDFSRATGDLSATCATHTFPDGGTWPRCSNAGGPG